MYGTGVFFKNLGVDVGEWTATGLGVGKTTPTKKLDVLGDSLFTGNVNISGALAADNIVLANICSTNISTSNLSTNKITFLTTYGLYQDFTGATNVSLAQVKGDILADIGATFSATTLNSSTMNASTINASTINGDNLSTASMLFNSDFQFSLNTLSLAPNETSAAIQSATLSTICLLYTSPSPRDRTRSRMPSSA